MQATSIWFMPVIGIALGLAGCQPKNDIATTAAMLDAERAAARKEGIPIEPSDLFSNGKTPDSENAAVTYLKAPEAMKKVDPEYGYPMAFASNVIRGKATPEDRRRLNTDLSRAAAYLAEIDVASRKPKVDFRRNWAAGIKLAIPEYGALNDVVRLLNARALLLSQSGDFPGCKSDIETAFRVAAHIGQEGLLVGQMVQAKCAKESLYALTQVVREHPADSAILDMARRVLETFPSDADFIRALKGEIVGEMLAARTVESFDQIESYQGGDYSVKPPKHPVSEPMRKAAEVRLMQFWRRVLPMAIKSQENFREAAATLDREQKAFEAHDEGSYLLAKVCLPVLSFAPEGTGSLRAWRTVTRAFVFALDERRKTGAWPRAFPTYLTDPFADKLLRFQATKDGFKVWSIGPNGVDDGGDRRSEAKPKADDIALSYP